MVRARLSAAKPVTLRQTTFGLEQVKPGAVPQL
jgi:hypothetical protein